MTIDLTSRGFRRLMQYESDREQIPLVDYLPVAGWLPSVRHLCGTFVGLPWGGMVTIGGRTGTNKTRIAATLAVEAALQGVNVGYVSLEMEPERYGRFVAANIGDREPTGRLLTEPTNTFGSINAVMEWMQARYVSDECRLFIVDHLQHLVSADYGSQWFKYVDPVVHRLWRFGLDSKCIVVVISQFNRPFTGRNVVPDVGGLAGGTALEQRSELILLIDHTRMQSEDHKAQTYLLVAKTRNGRAFTADGAPIGIPIEINYLTHSIREAEPDEEDEWPE